MENNQLTSFSSKELKGPGWRGMLIYPVFYKLLCGNKYWYGAEIGTWSICFRPSFWFC